MADIMLALFLKLKMVTLSGWRQYKFGLENQVWGLTDIRAQGSADVFVLRHHTYFKTYSIALPSPIYIDHLHSIDDRK